MKALLCIEHIGYNMANLGRGLGPLLDCSDPYAPHVTRVTRLLPGDIVQGTPVRGQYDFSRANGVGSRGVWLNYALDEGVYHVTERLTWANGRKRFVLSEAGEIRTITLEEAKRCLASGI